MTIDEFIGKLEQVEREFQLLDGRIVFVSNSWTSWNAMSVVLMELGEQHQKRSGSPWVPSTIAGMDLGLSYKDALAILSASNKCAPYSKKLRTQLLKATGLFHAKAK